MESSVPVKVLFHANCQDGWAAAWVAHCHLPEDAEYIPVQYGQNPPDVRGARVLILDFSYRRDVLLAMAKEANSITVIDHHKTAMADLCPPGVEGGTFDLADNVRVTFDMTRSGAMLTWRHFSNEDAPFLVELVQDRDLWSWAIPESRALNAWLATVSREFEAWDIIANDLSEPYPTRCPLTGSISWNFSGLASSAVEQGKAILRYQDQLVDAICANAREVEVAGHTVLAANTSVLFSEVAGKLAEGKAFGLAYFRRADGQVQYSARSRDDGVDVSAVAKQFGGGGHRAASGWQSMTAP